MIQSDLSLRQHQDGPEVRTIDNLALALHTETRLLLELTEALRRQRQGVAADDLVMVDDSMFASNRIMRTLGEARRRRRTLVMEAWSEELPLPEWTQAYARFMTPALRDALDRLQSAADVLAREIAINHTVLRDALSVGEGLLRAVTAPAQPTTYAPFGPGDIVQSGILLDRKV